MSAHTRRAGRKHSLARRVRTRHPDSSWPPRWARGGPRAGWAQGDTSRRRGDATGAVHVHTQLQGPEPGDGAGSHRSRKALESNARSPIAGRGPSRRGRPGRSSTAQTHPPHTGRRTSLSSCRGARQFRAGLAVGLGPALPSTGFRVPVGTFLFCSCGSWLLSGCLSGLGVSVYPSLPLAPHYVTTEEPSQPQERARIQMRLQVRGLWGQSPSSWLASACLCDDGTFSFL